ncbi:MAG TPA: D-isomer specific 2-hydroxyacid dehydrogenase family protein, partial [Acidimicrobiales bacterium]|nr:D-isomer specific 2-hydroxyacid dehydrogenase family protein [Acidimicrobiales bacterium]
SWLAGAMGAGGGGVVPAGEAEGLVWASTGGADELAALVATHAELRWIQLPWAGIEPFAGVLDPSRTWTCGKGVYAEPVAEHALMLGLAGLRGLAHYARVDRWERPRGHNLLGAEVVILGGGGIAESLLRLLGPFGTRTTVVRRHPAPMEGAAQVVAPEALHDVLPAATLVVLALPLVPETVGIIGRRELDLMASHAWLVNVARGGHVVTDDLVAALQDGSIGGAALDVTDPEPLPEDHPLWSLPNCLITPHVGNTPEMAVPLLAARISANVARFAAGEPLIGLVDPALGY